MGREGKEGKKRKERTVNVALALIRLRDEEVGDVSADMVLVADGVAAKDLLESASVRTVSVYGGRQAVEKQWGKGVGREGNVHAGIDQSAIAIHPLNHGDHLRRRLTLVLQPPNLHGSQHAIRGVGDSVGQLLLHQLVLGDRVVFELLPIERVGARAVDAVLQRAHRPPRDAVAGRVQTAERPAKALDVRKHVSLGHGTLIELNHAGDGSAQAVFVLERRRLEGARRACAALDEEAADLACRVQLGPDEEEVGDGGVGDPGLGAGEGVVALFGRVGFGEGLERARVGAVVGFGEAEAAEQAAGGEGWEVFFFLLRCAEFVDAAHHQRALHRHARAVARVDALDFARDEARRYAADARAAVALDCCAEEAEFAHFGEDLAVVLFVAVGIFVGCFSSVLAFVWLSCRRPRKRGGERKEQRNRPSTRGSMRS